MENEHLISADVFCMAHQIDRSFIFSLQEIGLLEVTVVEENIYISKAQLSELEKMIRMHFELEINLEGIDAIGHLLTKVADLSEEVRVLRNRLERYSESDEDRRIGV